MSKKPVAFLNTFDYELFLGAASGSVHNCLIRPTEFLLQVLRKHQAPAIFFIDAAYLCRLKEISGKHIEALNDFTSIAEQLRRIKKEGHTVFLHLHPHWLDAAYDDKNNQWNLSNYRYYSFEKLPESQKEEVFRLSFQMLEDIVGQSKDAMNGFRAGGLYIQPFEAFRQFFIEHAIAYDFSVLRNATGKGQDDYSFDFTRLPRALAYRFETDVTKEDENGRFAEFTLNSIKMHFGHRLLNKMEVKFADDADIARFGDGLPAANKIYYKANSSGEVWETMSVEYMTRVKERRYFEIASKDNYLHLLSHPKLFSIRALSIYDQFLNKLKANFEIVSDLKSILQMQQTRLEEAK